jgi:hypothetical protein
MVKYNADRENINIDENLQIIRSQFFTEMLLFFYIWSTLNIYWFTSIRICCQRIPMNSYSVPFDYSYYSVAYSLRDHEGNFKLFVPTYFGDNIYLFNFRVSLAFFILTGVALLTVPLMVVILEVLSKKRPVPCLLV